MSSTEQTIPFTTMTAVNAGHTPGPWGIETTEGSLWVGPMRASGAKVDEIVVHLEHGALYRHQYSERAAANAKLIAAAPDMLAALEAFANPKNWVLNGCFDPNSGNFEGIRFAAAAIRKATTA
jgi:hypothetical protein